MTAPDPEAKAGSKAIKDAYDECCKEGIIDPTKVYVNAHGTGTPLNDKSETIALKKVFGDDAYKIVISSTKSMTGHMLGGTGAVEAIASILTIKNGIVPPTINLDVPDIQAILHISRPAVSYILNSLEKKDYIFRKISPDDRRKIAITATDAGIAAAGGSVLHADGPGRQRLQAQDAAQQRGLSRAGRSEHGDELAGRKREEGILR